MNIIFITPECYPYTRNSFLGDLVYSLSKGIEQEGHNVKVFLPRYGCIDPNKYLIERFPHEFKVADNIKAITYKGILNGSLVSTFLIDSPHHFSNSKEIYLEGEKDEERFDFFCKASIEIISGLKFPVDAIHLINPQSTFCIDYFDKISLDNNNIKTLLSLYNPNHVSQKINEKLMIAANKSNLITTTSETYKKEMLNGRFNIGIEGTLNQYKNKFEGFFHGIDESEYCPETDKLIAQCYSKSYFSIGKRKCKEDLLSTASFEEDLNKPTFGVIGNISQAEGMDSFVNAIPSLANLGINIVIAGTGELTLVQELKKASIRYKNIKFYNQDDADIHKKIYAGADFLIAPGIQEYSGISILIGMRYGVIPITLETITSKEFLIDIENEEGNAIIFKSPEKNDLVVAISRSLEIYKNRQEWPKLVKRVMNFDSSAKNIINKYIEFYENAYQKVVAQVSH